MNAFLASAIHSETSNRGQRDSVLSWIKRRLGQRRRNRQERLEIERLRKLDPHLLRDAGIDESQLHAAIASIVELHPAYPLYR
jgi:uncharacterized protein YjiS (DUF1127 family)